MTFTDGQILYAAELNTLETNITLKLNDKEELTAGENVVNGDLCYLKSDGKFWKADADADTTSNNLLAIATESISADATGTFRVQGTYTTTGLTAGSIYYVSATAGAITATAPSTTGQIVRIAGYALSTTLFYFKPGDTFIEVA